MSYVVQTQSLRTSVSSYLGNMTSKSLRVTSRLPNTAYTPTPQISGCDQLWTMRIPSLHMNAVGHTGPLRLTGLCFKESVMEYPGMVL